LAQMTSGGGVVTLLEKPQLERVDRRDIVSQTNPAVQRSTAMYHVNS